MGEYAAYIWASYIVAALVLSMAVVVSVVDYRRTRSRVDALESGPDRGDSQKSAPEGAASASMHPAEDAKP